jgi:hypothetical protein
MNCRPISNDREDAEFKHLVGRCPFETSRRSRNRRPCGTRLTSAAWKQIEEAAPRVIPGNRGVWQATTRARMIVRPLLVTSLVAREQHNHYFR